MQHVDRLKQRYFGHVMHAKVFVHDILTGAMNRKRREENNGLTLLTGWYS